VRRTTQFWRLVEACEEHGVRLVSVVDPIDTSSPMGKGVAGMLAAMGEQESHNIGTRVRRKQTANATEGKPHGGARAFGFALDGVTLVRDEAKAIREARDRIFAGDSMRAICNDWNARGIKPPGRKNRATDLWRITTLKRIMTSPRLAGLRTYQGAVVPGVQMSTSIISVEDHERLVAILGDPRVRTRGRPPSYLLTGLLRCGRCGAVLRSSVGANGKARTWVCKRTPGDRAHCGRCSINAEKVDELIEAAVIDVLDSAKFRRMRTRAQKAHAKRSTKTSGASIAELEARLVQLGADYDEGLISRGEWLARRGPLQARLDVARDELAETPDPLARFDEIADVRRVWKRLTLDVKRAVLRALLDPDEGVTIHPPERPRNTFDPERVDPHWIV
jgi:hypothetical protein